MCDELKQANKIIKKLHDSNQEQIQKVFKFLITQLSKNIDILFSSYYDFRLY